MNTSQAKSKLRFVYDILQGREVNELSRVKVCPWQIDFDGSHISVLPPDKIEIEPSPILEEFFTKYQEVLHEIEAEKWSKSEALDLLDYAEHLWRQHFG